MKIEKSGDSASPSSTSGGVGGPNQELSSASHPANLPGVQVSASKKIPEGLSKATYQEYDKACREGHIKSVADLKVHAPRLIENECIVDPDSHLAVNFQKYMTDLTARLLRGSSWQPPSEVLFLISCSDQSNAYVLSKTVPPVIVFTTGMLRELRNCDELAYLLGHELGHIKSKTSGYSVRRSKGDEIAADLYQVGWLHQAGLNPLAGANLMARFWRKGQKDGADEAHSLSLIVALTDEHLSSALRPNMIQNSVQGYARVHGIEAGFMHAPYTAIDPLFTEIAQQSTPYDHIAHEAKKFGFESLSGEQQLEFILSQIKDLGPGFAPHTRPLGIKGLLEQCECDPEDSRHRELGMECLSAMLTKPEVFNTCYGTLVENTLNEEEYTPVGELEELAASIEQVLQAESVDELKVASHSILNFVDRFPGLALRNISLPCFELPSTTSLKNLKIGCEISLPWNRHVAWAKDLASAGDQSALRALFRLGVEDKRVIEAMDVETVAEIVRGYRSGSNLTIITDTGENPLIISRVPGRNKLGTLEFDFNTGSILKVYDPSNSKGGAWTPAIFAQNQISVAIGRRAKEEALTLHTRKLHPAESINSESSFQSWIAENIQSLNVPALLIGKTTDRRKLKGDALRKQNEMSDLEIKETCNQLRPIHSQFIETITGAWREHPHELTPIIRSFFMEEGNYTIHHVLSCAPRVYQIDHLMDERETLLSSYETPLPKDYPEVEFVLKDPCGLFTLEEKLKIFRKISTLPRDSAWYISNFCTSVTGIAEEQATANIKALEGVFKFLNMDGVEEEVIQALERFIPELLQNSGDSGDLLLKLHSIAPLLTKKMLLIESRYWDKIPICEKLHNEMTSLLADRSRWPSSVTDLATLYRLAENGDFLNAQVIYRGLSEHILSLLSTESSALEKQQASEILLLDGVTVNPKLKAGAITAWKDAQWSLLLEENMGEAGLDDDSQEFFDKVLEAAKRVKERAPGTLTYELLAQLGEKLETQEKLSYALESFTPIGGFNIDKSDPQIRVLEALTLLFSGARNRRFYFIDFLSEPLTPAAQKEFGVQMRALLNNGALLADFRDLESYLIDPRYEIDGSNDSEEYWRIKSEQVYESFWQLPLTGRAAIIDQLLLPAEKRFHHDFSMEKEEYEESLKGDYVGQHRLIIENNYKKNAFSYVARKCFPDNMKYSSEACTFLELYSTVIPPLQKNLLLSILLSVERKSAGYSEGEFGVGKRLAMILDMMGPAERKFGQGINSHPSSPADLRYDARELKFNASPLTRWDAWHEINRTVPAMYRPSIARLGPPLGSASYYVTYRIKRSDGTKGALRMLRNNAFDQGREGFRLLRDFIDAFRVKNPESDEICEILDDLISQARSMSYVETNSKIGVAQMLHGKDLYNGYKIKVDDHTFYFTNAGWRAYGAEFMDQEYQEGTHFIELPEGDELPQPANEIENVENPKRRYKRAAAKAYITMEFINILSGKAFDHDRHGAQLRLLRVSPTETKIGLFDNGAIHAEVRKADGTLAEPYREGREISDDYNTVLAAQGRVEIPPPTFEEKRLLVRTLAQSIKEYLGPEKRPIAETLYDEIRRIRKETGATPEYLLRVQRALLALNDFFGFGAVAAHSDGKNSTELEVRAETREPYLNDSDLVDILSGIFQTKDDAGKSLIDPDIERELYDVVAGPRFGSLAAWGNRVFGGSLLAKFSQFKSDNPVLIARNKPIEDSVPVYYESHALSS